MKLNVKSPQRYRGECACVCTFTCVCDPQAIKLKEQPPLSSDSTTVGPTVRSDSGDRKRWCVQPGNRLSSERKGGPARIQMTAICLVKDVHFGKSDQIIPSFQGFQREVINVHPLLLQDAFNSIYVASQAFSKRPAMLVKARFSSKQDLQGQQHRIFPQAIHCIPDHLLRVSFCRDLTFLIFPLLTLFLHKL